MTTLLIVAFLMSLVCVGAIVGAVVVLKKKFLSSTSADKDVLLQRISTTTGDLRSMLPFKDSYASKGQLDFLNGLLTTAQGDLEKEKATLREIEGKLGHAQKQVEEKETKQQDVKSAKAEDETRLQELLARYEELSTESISLEQKLAASLKNLDSIMDEIELTQDQRGVLQELSNSLTAAGSRLRDLLTEYEQVNQRLMALRQQHVDLEDEYTKLVEQQLGD